MTRIVVFRDDAARDLENLYDYIADQSSPDIAIGYIGRIRERCMSLARFPEQGRQRDDLLPNLRTIGFERRVTIAYRVLKTKVEIVSVAYGGRAFEGGLEDQT